MAAAAELEQRRKEELGGGARGLEKEREAVASEEGEQQCEAAGSGRWDEWIRCKKWTSAYADMSIARPLGATKQSPDKIAPDSPGPHDPHGTERAVEAQPLSSTE